ncbi:membrane-associated protein, putative [Bodo saltans]|uniref:Membrane-associated protein, putative n=1 Tax=Bodo saltans TaxID=75058 RepID=A0A0S4J0I0_BODSA|nr:membrane-associated protein, putative [Bodo saltans]|eukprot:CUG41729.1 membrane-associated protein, putative [Bodo saltans]
MPKVFLCLFMCFVDSHPHTHVMMMFCFCFVTTAPHFLLHYRSNLKRLKK